MYWGYILNAGERAFGKSYYSYTGGARDNVPNIRQTFVLPDRTARLNVDGAPEQ